MALGKKKVIVYTDWIHQFKDLTDEEAGKLIKHFFDYINDLNPKSDRLTELLFNPIKATLKRDLEAWELQQKINRENGSKGGRPKKELQTEKNQKNPFGYFETEKNQNKGVNDSVSVNVSVNENDNVNVKEKEKNIISSEIKISDHVPKKRFIPPNLEEVKDYCFERNNQVDAQRFIDYYTSNGWMVGKNKMKDWKSAVRTWEKNNYSINTGNNGNKQQSTVRTADDKFADFVKRSLESERNLPTIREE